MLGGSTSRLGGEVKTYEKIFMSLTALATAVSFTLGGYYIADTLSGKNTTLLEHLKVIGFCPNITPTPAATIGTSGAEGADGEPGVDGEDGETGATGAPGKTGPAGATGATGAAGICTGMVALTAITGDMVPAVDNLYTLGTSSFRWKGLQLGPGTLYIQDTVTGAQAGLTVTDGSLLIDGADSLRIGNVRLTASGIRSVLSDQDITIGAPGDTGWLSVAHGIKFMDGSTLESARAAVGAQGPAGATGATGSNGAAGSTGATGATGPQGPAGSSGGPLYVSYPEPRELDLSNQVFALEGGTYYLPDGKEGQMVHFVITDRADITGINITVSHLRYTHGSDVRVERDENWTPFDVNLSPVTMVSAVFTKDAWNISGGKTH